MKAIATGTLFDGSVDCYVLEDGRSAISKRGAVRALSGGRDRGDLGRYLDRLPAKIGQILPAPIFLEIHLPNGAVAHGMLAQSFVDVLDAYVDGFFEGTLHPTQERLAANARRILKGLQGTAIDALIHEATGYERHKEHEYLQRKFEQILRATPDKWERKFPPTFTQELTKLYGYSWDGTGRIPRWLSSPLDKFYRITFGDEIKRELKRRNPAPQFDNNHHQLLQASSQRFLEQNVAIASALARISKNAEEFWDRMSHNFRREPLQLDLID